MSIDNSQYEAGLLNRPYDCSNPKTNYNSAGDACGCAGALQQSYRSGEGIFHHVFNSSQGHFKRIVDYCFINYRYLDAYIAAAIVYWVLILDN